MISVKPISVNPCIRNIQVRQRRLQFFRNLSACFRISNKMLTSVVVFCCLMAGTVLGKRSGYREPGPLDMTLDERIINAMTTSRAGDFIQNNETLLVELDVLLSPEEWKARQNKRSSYAGIRRNLWEGGVIPYDPIGNEFSGSDKQKIMDSFKEYHDFTCLRFRPAKRRDIYRIYFNSGSGCSSHVGTVVARQAVSLARGCRNHGVIVHELGHAVGMHHEQTRPDRDQYVTIVKSNINKDMLYNFDKYTAQKIDSRDLPYDYLSVMHYGSTAFALDYSRNTIKTHDPSYQSRIGQRNGLSFEDVHLLNIMYNCGGHCNVKCPQGSFVGKDCNCYCRQDRNDKHEKPIVQCGKGTTGGGGSTGGGGGGGSSNCEDIDKDCAMFASHGSCTNAKYISYMQIYCKKSCRFCHHSPSACVDKDGRCELWAENGVCSLCKKVKETICPVSCRSKKCSGPSGDDVKAGCTDDNYLCPDWAEAGLCGEPKHQAHLRRICQRSCGVCGSNAPADPGAACVDISRQCPKFKREGGCEENPHWMNQFCKRSCKTCGAVYRSYRHCKDANDDCGAWVKRGMCTENSDYMRENCPKSCDFC